MDYDVLSPLQLTLCSKNTKTGKELRSILEEMSLPNFYQLMNRLEKSNYIKGEYFTTIGEIKRERERRYIITKLGRKELRRTIEFYKYWQKL